MHALVIGSFACAVSACGRIGFEPLGGGDAVAPTTTTTTTCAGGITNLALARGVPAGETLVVSFFMREAQAGVPTIRGGPNPWSTDVSFTTAQSINARHISVFRAIAVEAVPPGTTLAIDHPTARAIGAAVLVVPDVVTKRDFSLGEGDGAFAGALDTAASASLCVVAHANNVDVAFAADWTPLFDLAVNCGEARDSGGMHAAMRTGTGQIACMGTVGQPWAIAMLGYDGLTAL